VSGFRKRWSYDNPSKASSSKGKRKAEQPLEEEPDFKREKTISEGDEGDKKEE
jgi:hypothetical protein